MPNGHKLEIRSKDESTVNYHIEAGTMAAGAGLSSEDHVIGGRIAEGAVAAGIDAYRYTGDKHSMVVSSDTAQFRINDKAWADATAYGARVDAGFFGGGSGKSRSGGGSSQNARRDSGGTSLDERIERAAGRDRPESVTVIESGDGYREAIEGVPYPMKTAERFAVTDGTHHAGTVQHSIATLGGAPVLAVVGNVNDPYACEIRGNQNFVCGVVKDEHFRIEGMTWGRTQFAGNGDPFIRGMVFTDRHGKSHSAIGGKRVCGRYQNTDVGHRDDPDEYAGYFFGGGQIFIDHGNVIRASGDAYFGVSNHATLYIGDSNEFASGSKEIVEGWGIYPEDLTNGINILECGELR